MIDSAMAMSPATGFEVHGARGRFNAAFFNLMEPYIEWNLRKHKRRHFADLLYAPGHRRHPRIEMAALGEQAGAIGAALLVVA